MSVFNQHIKISKVFDSHLMIGKGFTPPSITKDTEIIIWFDSSGSMNSTLAPLEEMRDTLLKDALLPFYNNDGDLYDEKVSVQSFSNERTFNIIATEPVLLENGIIHLVFQDEASPVYHSSVYETPTSTYLSDITALRDKLVNTFPNNKFKSYIFQVATPGIDSNNFHIFPLFLEAVELGTGNYSGGNGLSDRNEVEFIYDVAPESTPEYYTELVKDAIFG